MSPPASSPGHGRSVGRVTAPADPSRGTALARPAPRCLVEIPAPAVRGVGLLSGWGEGLAALEAARREPAAGLVAVPTPALAGERFRRATRECLLAVAAVQGALEDAGLAPASLAGDRTGILYVTATGYAASNRAFLEDDSSTTLHFPYTSPSVVPGEVTIEYGLRGPYVNLMGGGTATLEALWCAARWLAAGVADRVLVLAVETVHEIWDLLVRARRIHGRPVLEAAAAVLLERGTAATLRWAAASAPGARADTAVAGVLDAVLGDHAPHAHARCFTARGPRAAEARALDRRGVRGARFDLGGIGETFACGPLIGLGQVRAAGVEGACLLTAAWRDDYGAMLWPLGEARSEEG